MAKPSIFSKNYEKKMKQRKIKIALIVVLIGIVSLGLFYKFKLKDMDFNQIVNSLQAWVNNDEGIQSVEKPKQDEVKPQVDENKEPAKETPIEEVLEFKLTNDEVIKFKVKEENKEKTFEEVNSKGYYTNISPNKKEAVVLDKNQNMFLVNVDGTIKNITKKEYVSKKGDKYAKDLMIEKEKNSGKNYAWGVDPEFIDDNTIAYISNLPYFGAAAKNKYVWIYNIEDNTYKAIYKTAAPNTEIVPNSATEKGIIVKVFNAEYILDNKGKLFKE